MLLHANYSHRYNSCIIIHLIWSFVMEKATANKKKILFTGQLDLNFRNKLVKCYIWGAALCGAVTWTLRKADQEYLESSEIWCWRKMEKIIWAKCVRSEVWQRVKEQRNILHTIQREKAKRIGHTLRTYCLLKGVIENKIEVRTEVKGRRWTKRKQLLNDLREKRGYRRLKHGSARSHCMKNSLW